MINLQSNRLLLRDLLEIDIPTLYQWRNSISFLNNCTHRNKLSSVKQFKKELNSDFNSDRLLQAMIFASQKPIGTIFSYGYNSHDLYCFVTTFISDGNQNFGFGLKSFILFCNYHFEKYNLYKIYADIYEYNKFSLDLFKKKNIAIEGVFKNQKLINGKRYDVYRFAIYKSDIDDSLKYCN